MANTKEFFDTAIVIDGVGAVCINHEKQILATEVIKHFRQRWQAEARETADNGKTPNAVHMVDVMFRKMSIDHEIVRSIVAVDVLNEDTAGQNITPDTGVEPPALEISTPNTGDGLIPDAPSDGGEIR